MTDHIYAWSVGVTERKVFVACRTLTPTCEERATLEDKKLPFQLCSAIVEHFVN